MTKSLSGKPAPLNHPYLFLRECHDFTIPRAEAVDSGRPYLAKKLVSRSEPDNDSRKSSPHILDGSPIPTGNTNQKRIYISVLQEAGLALAFGDEHGGERLLFIHSPIPVSKWQ